MTLFAGFDPGTKLIGVGVVETRGGRAAVGEHAMPLTTTYRRHAMVGADEVSIERELELLAALARDAGAGLVVVVETVVGFPYDPRRGGALIATNLAAGKILGAARAARLRTLELPRQKWRKLLCGHGSANDDAVRTSVERLVYGLPKRTNSHTRDALGISVGGAWHLGGKA